MLHHKKIKKLEAEIEKTQNRLTYFVAEQTVIGDTLEERLDTLWYYVEILLSQAAGNVHFDEYKKRRK